MSLSFGTQTAKPAAPSGPSPFPSSTSISLNSTSVAAPRSSSTHHLLESRAFLTETYTLWANLQRIVDDYEQTALSSALSLRLRAVRQPPPAEQVQYYGRVASLYRQAITTELSRVKADQTLSPPLKSKTLSHYSTTHGLLALAEILYFPSDGTGEGLVAEELLDWVNTVDRAPSAEEGAHLSSLSTPWDDPSFLPYLYRCLLRGHLSSSSALLSLLASSHPSSYLRTLAAPFVQLLDSYPRSSNGAYRSEGAYLAALRGWKTSSLATATRSLETAFSTSPSSSDDDPLAQDQNERAEWVSAFRALLAIVSGSETTLLSLSEDWREALAAWGLWVNPGGLRRQDLPTTLGEVVAKEHPIDATLEEEKAQWALLHGDAAGVLKCLTAGGWSWLATHLADLLSHLNLPAFDTPVDSTKKVGMDEDDGEGGNDDDLPLGLREHFLLDWATRLSQSDEGLWRLSCEYWGACGKEGRTRARALLKGLKLDEAERLIENTEGNGVGMDVEESAEGDGGKKKRSRVEEVLGVCSGLGLEEEMKDICQNYAALLVSRKRFGEAIAFSVRADDGRRIAEIAGLILDEYIENGQAAFISHVDSIPTSLLRPSRFTSSSSSSSSSSSLDDTSDSPVLPSSLLPHASRLSFLARYRDFFALYAQGERRAAAELLVLLLTSGAAPRGVRGVMLIDVLGLLETSPPLVSLSETHDLLRILEDVVGPVVSSSPPADVFGDLAMLGRLSEKAAATAGAGAAGVRAIGEEGAKEEQTGRALEQIEVVRGALARHLALCVCLE